MKTGDVLEDMLGAGVSLASVMAFAAARADLIADYDGPPTVRDVESEGPDTSPEASFPTWPVPYSREAA